jgi:hypothetical protein
VSLISPTTGEIIKIKNCRARIATSADGLNDLKRLEEQIIGQTVLPDFGYAGDNYILEREEATNKWSLLTELLGNNEKYQWLIEQIKVRMLRKETVKN